MRLVFLILSTLLAFSCGIAEAQIDKRVTFMPENDFYKEDGRQISNITEQEFNFVLDEIEKVYAPIFQNFGATLVLERDWANSTVNAYADRAGNNWIVHMYGGMARRSEMNILGFGQVACHEIGHHLAGWPLWEDYSWAANEGNSDYFANFVCAKKVYAAIATPQVSGTIKSKCDTAFTSDGDREICYKGLVGGQALGNLLARLGGTKNPSYDTPDGSVVNKTKPEHPKAQCRLDTYLAGSLCAKTWNDSVIPDKDGYTCDNRPRCWFAPEGGGDPGPGPDPEGDGAKLIGLINEFRTSNGRAALTNDTQLQCMADLHAEDIGPMKYCSHMGTKGQPLSKRKKMCGRTDYVVEIIACNRDTTEEAMDAWKRSKNNYYTILTPYYRGIGCAVNNTMHVCVMGI